MPLYLNGVENVADPTIVALNTAARHTEDVIYSSTMSGHETFSQGDEMGKVCFLDANGSSRNFNPTGTFLTGYRLYIINIGGENIVLDSEVLNSIVASGKLGLFYYDGSIWH